MKEAEMESKKKSRWVKAREELTALGVLVDSGKRCPVTGQIVWKVNPDLTEEQAEALIKGAPDYIIH
jgi:hypothetical protein